MRQKISSGVVPIAAPVNAKPVQALEIPHDPANEAAVISAALRDPSLLKTLIRKVVPDHFLARQHRDVWSALAQMARVGLDTDPAAIRTSAGEDVANACEQLRSFSPAQSIQWHLANLFWDSARATAAKGPIPAFLDAFKDPKADRDRVASLARQIVNAFHGYEDRRFLHDPATLVRDQMKKVEERVSGRAVFTSGIKGLDLFENGRRRITVGMRPGNVTILTSLTGSGKSTTAANMTIGMAYPGGVDVGEAVPGRRILYGAWEMNGGITLELLACMSLGWSRTDLTEGVGAIAAHEGRVLLEERMHLLGKRVRFLSVPFDRNVTTDKKDRNNDRNLDVLQGYISDSGCDLFIGDLWKRCLRATDPDSEELALYRQQAMAEELGVHCLLLQQQRSKDIEQRPDKRPTREGIKGSGAWTEIADLVIGTHRPGLWKKITDDKIEMFILKQREGRWPLGVEFEWNPERGSIEGGRSIEYDQPGDGNEIDNSILGAWAEKKNGKRDNLLGLQR